MARDDNLFFIIIDGLRSAQGRRMAERDYRDVKNGRSEKQVKWYWPERFKKELDVHSPYQTLCSYFKTMWDIAERDCQEGRIEKKALWLPGYRMGWMGQFCRMTNQGFTHSKLLREYLDLGEDPQNTLSIMESYVREAKTLASSLNTSEFKEHVKKIRKECSPKKTSLKEQARRDMAKVKAICRRAEIEWESIDK